MKNAVAPNRKTGRMIAKNLIILLVLVVVTFVAMWAWFTEKTVATASGVNVVCNAPDSVEIAVVGHGAAAPANEDYKLGSISLANQPFLSELTLSEITSDGIDFYKPMLTQANGIAKPDTTADWDVATPNGSYMSFDLYIRSKSPQVVSLAPGSKFTTVSETLIGADAGNKSTYGNFSRDCVIGASRFSVVNSTGDERKLLWIPRPDILFSSPVGGTPVIATDVTTTDYDGKTYKHNYYEVTADSKTLTTMDDSLVTASAKSGTDYILPKKTEIARLSNLGDDEYYTTYVTCNMWIEGEDDEARLALVKGKFKIYLDLTIK